MDKAKDKLIGIIVNQTDWGPVADWQGGDFRKLSALIFEKTRVNLSESTLRRVLGKADYPHLPSETTLNTLALFAGYESWRAFRQQFAGDGDQPAFNIRYAWYGAAFVFIIALSAATYKYLHATASTNFNYSFSSRPVTRGIPNSIIFTYGVGKETAPVYIQQSWDDATREHVPANGKTFASVYYRPGYFEAKLIVGGKVVKQHPLIIPTNGWTALFYRSPVPVYLSNSEFCKPGMMEVTDSTYKAHDVKTEPEPVRAELYNVGNFKPVTAGDATFSALIKCNNQRGAGVCRKALAFLVTNGIPISIPISARGCVATLGLFNGREAVMGRTADLSGFGTDDSSWVKVGYSTSSGKLQLLVNDKVAYTSALPPAGLKIVGIAFGLDNGGAVKSILLQEKGRTVFKAY